MSLEELVPNTGHWLLNLGWAVLTVLTILATLLMLFKLLRRNSQLEP